MIDSDVLTSTLVLEWLVDSLWCLQNESALTAVLSRQAGLQQKPRWQACFRTEITFNSSRD
jgi:hypothetical protein